METLIKAAWLVLGLVHTPPGLVAVRPGLVEALYGVPADGPTGLLLAHRGVLFLTLTVLSAYAAFSPQARRAASIAVGVSVVGFLVLYAGAGLPTGPLRTIAVADAVALAPLAVVAHAAWRHLAA